MDGHVEEASDHINAAQIDGGTWAPSLYVENTIPDGITEMSSEDSYVHLVLNGDEVDLDDEEDELVFKPRVFSSPSSPGLVNYSSHIRSVSTFDGSLDNENPPQRHLAGRNVIRRINDTSSESESEFFNASMYAGLPERWDAGELWQLKYINDGLNGEKNCNLNAVSHITNRKEVKYLHSKRAEENLKLTVYNGNKIGMKINTPKTQMIRITVAKNSLVNSFINLPEGSTVSLKMLGFVFRRRPTADAHVTHIKKKFYAKLWVIRFLIRANVSGQDLCKIYCNYLRPVIEYASNVYHHLLTDELSDQIEKISRPGSKNYICFQVEK